MSQAEIFRIIDVLTPAGSPDAEPAAAPASGREAGDLRPRSAGPLAIRSHVPTVALARPGPPTQAVALQYVGLPDILDERLVMLREPESPRARSYRLLRHRLLSRGDPRIVEVTSARPGEGKTTCALNLALALAEDTMTRVLLLDANLRRPALGRVLGFEPLESLVGNITRFTNVAPPYPVAVLGGTRLHVAALPAAPLPDARLDRTLFAVALADLRVAYDYIVIDAASVLESGDADVIGECSGGAIVTARRGCSRRAEVRRAIEQLAPVKVLGAVLLDA